MSTDEDDGPPTKMSARMRRMRARRGMDSALSDAEAGEAPEAYQSPAFDFGYGGWTVTLDGLAMPEPERSIVPARDGGVGGRTRIRPRAAEEETPLEVPSEARQPLTSRPGASPGRARRAAATPDPGEHRKKVAPGAERGRRPARAAEGAEDRPLIAPDSRRRNPASAPQTTAADPRRLRRRPRRESPARPEGARGVRKRRTQRIEGGGTVMIDDELFPLVDWSAGGIAIRSEGQPHRIGDRRKLELEIDLDDYAVNLDLEGEVVNRSSERTGWQFVAPTETQLDVLRALTRASLTGEPFAAPPSTPADRRRAKGQGEGRRRPGPLAAALSLPLNLVVIALAAGTAVYALSDGRMPGELVASIAPAPPVRSEQAAVAVERVPVRADTAGTVGEWRAMPGEALIAGEPLVVISHGASAEEAVTPPDAAGEDETVTAQAADDANAAATDGGQTVRTVLTSPCDCTLISRSLETGASVAAGETVALLAPGGSGGHIEALFSPARAPRPGDVVAVDLPASGERYEGVVEAIGPAEDPESILDPPAAARDGDGALLARIRTRPALPVTRAGDLAIVTVTPGA